MRACSAAMISAPAGRIQATYEACMARIVTISANSVTKNSLGYWKRRGAGAAAVTMCCQVSSLRYRWGTKRRSRRAPVRTARTVAATRSCPQRSARSSGRIGVFLLGRLPRLWPSAFRQMRPPVPERVRQWVSAPVPWLPPPAAVPRWFCSARRHGHQQIRENGTSSPVPTDSRRFCAAQRRFSLHLFREHFKHSYSA